MLHEAMILSLMFLRTVFTLNMVNEHTVEKPILRVGGEAQVDVIAEVREFKEVVMDGSFGIE